MPKLYTPLHFFCRKIFIFADINRLTTNILPFVMMNKCLTTLAFCLISFACFGQQFTCEKLEETVTRWNETRASLSSDSSTIDWAQAVIDNKVYSFNEKNEVGYDFIIHSSDTLDFDRLKEVTIDYLQFYMNLSQRDRESVVQSSLDRSVFYQSYYYNLAVQTGVVQVGVFSVYSQVYFEFKFKEDRIRIQIHVPFVHYETKLFKGVYSVGFLYPFSSGKGLSKLQKESQAQALINVHSRSLNYAQSYLNWLNSRYAKNVSSDDDDW